MSATFEKGFDDRLFMIIGVPVVSFIVLVFFFRETPKAGQCHTFLISWLISALYTGTYWFFSRWLISFWRKRCPGIEHTNKRIIKTVISLISVVIVFEALCQFVVGWEDLFRATNKSAYTVLKTAPISMILVITMTGIYEAMYFLKLYRSAELEKERLLRSQVENQLDALRKQVDPHFLFNSLNTLAAIIPEDAAAAQLFTERLSATYRRLLEWRHNPTVTLAQELEALQDYIHLLEVRFEGRLKVDMRIDTDANEYFIAPLALQLLVENAVKHNEASLAHPLVVDIYTEGNSITVANLKRLKSKKEVESTGFGLENLRDRVRFLSEQEIKVVDTDSHFSVSIPLLEMAPISTAMQTQKAS